MSGLGGFGYSQMQIPAVHLMQRLTSKMMCVRKRGKELEEKLTVGEKNPSRSNAALFSGLLSWGLSFGQGCETAAVPAAFSFPPSAVGGARGLLRTHRSAAEGA